MNIFTNFLKGCIVVSMVAVPMSPAVAQIAGGSVTFTANVDESCTIQISDAGVLGLATNSTVLSSTATGGNAGAALITTTAAGINLTVTNPITFTSAPATANDAVTFATQYELSGATTVGSTVAGTTSLTQGVNNIELNMTATKTTGFFPAGNYSASVVLTCDA